MLQQILTLYQENDYEPFLVFTEDFFRYFLMRECELMEVKDVEKFKDKGYVGKWCGTPVYVLPKEAE